MTHRSSLTVAVLVPALFATTVVDRAAAQSEVDSLAALTDQVFAHLDKLDSPGCTCAVMRDGEVVYSRAFGMANLEHDVPLTPQSVFEVGSVTKQFTAASIALLVLRGQLSLDDDIRVHLPEMANFGKTIRIRHLLHHTSGLRDYPSFQRLSGVSPRDYSNGARTLALLARQRTLNFPPGEAHLYSNSGYFLLAEIVGRVSGKSLREFAEDNIFAPLGMARTRFDDNYRRIVEGRVQSYGTRRAGGLVRFLENRDIVGQGGLLTTVEDLARWDRNFYDMRVGGQDFIDLMLTRGILNNGDTLVYSLGLENTEYRGLKTVHHSGSRKGFVAMLMRFPDQRFSVAVLCNLGTIKASALSRQVADIYLRDVLEARTAAEDERPPAPNAVEPEPPTPAELESYLGTYFSEELNYEWVLRMTNERLRMWDPSTSAEFTLRPVARDVFRVGNMSFMFTRDGQGRIVGFAVDTPRARNMLFVRR